MHGTLIAGYALLIACILPTTQANTEIVNIHAVRSVVTGRKPPLTWYVRVASAPSALTPPLLNERPVLSASSSELTLELEPIPLSVLQDADEGETQDSHDLWAVLDFDDPAWSGFSKFTLRASLPANVSCSRPFLHVS